MPKPASSEKKGSQPTFMLVPCLMNLMRSPVIHRTPVAIPVNQGPQKFWCSCQCGFFAYLPKTWQKTWGMTEAEALRQGFLVPTSM